MIESDDEIYVFKYERMEYFQYIPQTHGRR